ncbi:hypothetical protein [Kribbella soli]|uniref:Uncharacterized protein n=1 Tax=Kribbella soli TaxID=1124743 RepID=A0A4V2M015_9ACTN|nr:hypothetical protein [Kribbella soli]TCC10336.1 hypothetical protein E0H45_03150 [Kribbella soli]
MFSYPTPDEVLAGLGDKVVGGLANAVVAVAADLVEYRRIAPHFVSRHSERGLANWIHDQMWSHVLRELDSIPNVSFVDKEPTRDVYVGLDYRLRVKRHSPTGAIRSYPTQEALSFVTQQPDLLSEDGAGIVNLCVGYEWDAGSRTIGGPVMSLRDGSFDEVIWVIDVSAGSGGEGTVRPMFPTGAPKPPTIGGTPNQETNKEEGSKES